MNDNEELIPIKYFTPIINSLLKWLPNLKLGEKNLYVPEYMPLKHHFDYEAGNYTTKSMAYSLSKYIKDFNYKKIIFLSHTEAFSRYYIDRMYEIIEELKKYDISIKYIVYIAGALPVNENIQLFEKLCKEKNVDIVNLYIINYLEHQMVNTKRIGEMSVRSFFNFPKEKKFTSMNGSFREHRVVAAAQLIDRNLLQYAYYSFYELNEELWSSYTDNKNVKLEAFPNLSNSTIDIITKHIKQFPIVLNKRNQNDSTETTLNLFFFEKSYFSLIGETEFIKFNGSYDNLFYECYDISEKTYRVIRYKHPFILMAKVHSLKMLRQCGYRTFHPYINESYDDIEDDETRLIAIIDEVERLCKQSDEEWLNFRVKVFPIVMYNFNVLMSKSLQYITNLN